jgi:glycosyltransferase involved in cell wall biosynthesis
MRVIVQIPCFNEEGALGRTLAAIPRRIDGVERVEILVVDDGSTDGTVQVAREGGADYVVRHTKNLGLARAFATGLDACLRLGADVIVNTDADNQYSGEDIPKLVQPILAGEADVVVGDRGTASLPHFSSTKKRLQALGSFVVGRLSHLTLPDAVSGFRALSREAALKINIVSSFSYTIEMLIQAGRKGLSVTSVPVASHRVDRSSRLFHGTGEFVQRSTVTMVRVWAMYHPLRFFAYLGSFFLLLGAAPVVRFLYLFYVGGQGQGHVQSLVLGGALLVIGCITVLFGLLADLVGFNRHLIEGVLERVRRLESSASDPVRDEGGRRSPR